MIKFNQTDPHDGTFRDLAPDLTPMLDIIFILLVFFMLTAGASYKTMNLNLPESLNDNLKSLNTKNEILLEIHQDFYRIEDKKIINFKDFQEEVQKLAKTNKDKELVIAGDKQVAIERLLQVLTYLQTNGIEAANILMKEKDI